MSIAPACYRRARCLNNYFFTFRPVVTQKDVEVGIALSILFRLFLLHEVDPSKQFQPKEVYLFGMVSSDTIFSSQGVPFYPCAVLEVAGVVYT